MKKRIVTAVLMLCMAFGLCACGGDNTNTEKENTQQESQKADSENKDSQAKDSESEDAADGKVVYSVKLVDGDGNPLAGQMVQVCDASTCFAPQQTNAEGVAEFKLEEAEGYKAKMLSAGDDAYVYFESGAKELTITVEE